MAATLTDLRSSLLLPADAPKSQTAKARPKRCNVSLSAGPCPRCRGLVRAAAAIGGATRSDGAERAKVRAKAHGIGCQGHSGPERRGCCAGFHSIRRLCPWRRHFFADAGYARDKLGNALAGLGTVQLIKRSDIAQIFEALPRRWAVERTFACLGKCCRLARDFETTIESLTAYVRRLTRALARACPNWDSASATAIRRLSGPSPLRPPGPPLHP
jgi:transposase